MTAILLVFLEFSRLENYRKYINSANEGNKIRAFDRIIACICCFWTECKVIGVSRGLYRRQLHCDGVFEHAFYPRF